MTKLSVVHVSGGRPHLYHVARTFTSRVFNDWGWLSLP
jgi:hypothetical protein